MFGDFKIGNCISFNGEYYKIIDISTYNNRTCYEIVSLKNNNKRIELKYYPIEPICIDVWEDGIGNVNNKYDGELISTYFNGQVDFQYIHELQNAYREWYNKELDIDFLCLSNY